MSPAWYSAAGAVPYLTPAADDVDPRYRQLVDLAIEGDQAFERKRDTIDEYGWRNFGDIYADHENASASDGNAIVSHYNNQYDGIAGFAIQFMRTGDARWWRSMSELATHAADIDMDKIGSGIESHPAPVHGQCCGMHGVQGASWHPDVDRHALHVQAVGGHRSCARAWQRWSRASDSRRSCRAWSAGQRPIYRGSSSAEA